MIELRNKKQKAEHIISRWYAISEIPTPIRETMQKAWARWDVRDLTLDGTLALVHTDPQVAIQIGVQSRASANRSRVPELCQAVHVSHPSLSWRCVWRAVGLFLGLHPSHVQRLCYRRNQ